VDRGGGTEGIEGGFDGSKSVESRSVVCLSVAALVLELFAFALFFGEVVGV